MNDSLYFCMMCGAETVEEVERAVEEGADVWSCDENGRNGLHWVCQNEWEEAEKIVRYLMKKAKNLMRMVDVEMWTPLLDIQLHRFVRSCWRTDVV